MICALVHRPYQMVGSDMVDSGVGGRGAGDGLMLVVVQEHKYSE